MITLKESNKAMKRANKLCLKLDFSFLREKWGEGLTQMMDLIEKEQDVSVKLQLDFHFLPIAIDLYNGHKSGEFSFTMPFDLASCILFYGSQAIELLNDYDMLFITSLKGVQVASNIQSSVFEDIFELESSENFKCFASVPLEKRIQIAQSWVEWFEENNLLESIGHANLLLGEYLGEKSSAESIPPLKKAEQNFEMTGKIFDHAYCCYDLGRAYDSLEDVKCLEYFKKARSLLESIGEEQKKFITHIQIRINEIEGK